MENSETGLDAGGLTVDVDVKSGMNGAMTPVPEELTPLTSVPPSALTPSPPQNESVSDHSRSSSGQLLPDTLLNAFGMPIPHPVPAEAPPTAPSPITPQSSNILLTHSPQATSQRISTPTPSTPVSITPSHNVSPPMILDTATPPLATAETSSLHSEIVPMPTQVTHSPV